MAGDFKRLRVRAMHKDYGDPGPDLLRPRDLAVKQFGSVMGKQTDGWFVRTRGSGPDAAWRSWSRESMKRQEVLRRIEAWSRNAGPGSKFQAGRKASGKVEPKAESLAVVVRHVAISGTNSGAELVADLAREQFDLSYVGGFACREYNNVPGSGWSDHAWGDAVDLAMGGGSANDRLTDWCVRMAQAGCMGDAAQFIGSRDGKVGTFYAPRYDWNAGGPSSHLTHVHCSYRQHYGRDPNCR